MTISKKIGVILLSGVVGLSGLELGSNLSIPGWSSHLSISGLSGVVSTAEARVGRPLSPVSVAGVGRRTARRCRNGTYKC
jgi:hypothetical protein